MNAAEMTEKAGQVSRLLRELNLGAVLYVWPAAPDDDDDVRFLAASDGVRLNHILAALTAIAEYGASDPEVALETVLEHVRERRGGR